MNAMSLADKVRALFLAGMSQQYSLHSKYELRSCLDDDIRRLDNVEMLELISAALEAKDEASSAAAIADGE